MSQVQVPGQRQLQKLALTQTLRQSIQVLQMGTLQLAMYIQKRSLDNPLMSVESHIELPIGNLDNTHSFDFERYQGKQHNENLYDYLKSQLSMTQRDTFLRMITQKLVDSLDERGYLSDFDAQKFCKDYGIRMFELEDAIAILQQLDPPGIGARSLQECLSLQLDKEHYPIAFRIVDEFFEQLIGGQVSELPKLMNVSGKTIKEALDQIKSLSTRPAEQIGFSEIQVVVPDLVMSGQESDYQLVLSKFSHLSVMIDQQSNKYIKAHQTSDIAEYIQEQATEVKALSEALIRRERTLMRVGQAIVRVQKEYLLGHHERIEPLQMNDLAERLNLSQATISRTVHDKYLQTPIGVIALRDLFTVRAKILVSGKRINKEMLLIKKLIESENPSRPLGDANLQTKLESEFDVSISRRTVSKYREQLNIPDSRTRKRMIASK